MLVAWSCPTLCNPMTAAHQAPLSMKFSRQEYWSWLPFPFPGDLPDPGVKPRSPALQADPLPSEPPEKPLLNRCFTVIVSFSNPSGRHMLGVLQSFGGWWYGCYWWDVSYVREQSLELGVAIPTLVSSPADKKKDKLDSWVIPFSVWKPEGSRKGPTAHASLCFNFNS